MSAYSLLSSGDRISDTRKLLRTYLNSYMSNRKLLAATLFVILFLLYFWPENGLFGGRSADKSDSVASSCLASELATYEPPVASERLVFTRSDPPDEFEQPFVPFVGNGRIGLAITPSDNQLHLSGGKALTVPTELRPLVSAAVQTYPFADGYVVQYDRGRAEHVRCFNAYADNCVMVTSAVYAHAVYTQALVQLITIKNPLDHSVEVTFSRPTGEAPGSPAVTVKSKNLPNNSGSVQVATSIVAAPALGRASTAQLALVAVLDPMKAKITIKAKHTEKLRFVSVIDYEETQSDQSSDTLERLEQQVLKMKAELASMQATDLDQTQEDVWKQLWQPSFFISWSHAPGALNTDVINATRYAVLANTPALIHQRSLLQRDKELSTAGDAKRALIQSELCYNSHHTLLYPSSLWSKLTTAEELVSTAYVWRLTLEKRGCMKLLSAGADGVAQAMLLSFGALKFTHHHLEFGTHPGDLHRDYAFGNILFGEAAQPSYVSIQVQVGEDNRALLYVSVRANHTNKASSFYACDAGCLDQPAHLSTTRTAFPVKLTEPLTAILYVADNLEHLQELKHTIHVREVAEAPAHEHHVLALHRHGHRLGGLHPMFWIALVLLILTFHLFLFKLVYTEWMRTGAVQPTTNAYRSRYRS